MSRPPPYVQLWNFTLEKQLGANTVAQIAYVGSKGTHLPINYAYNICQQSRANVAAYGWDAANMDSPYCPGAAAAVGGAWSLYVNPGWWGISNSIYHSMQAKFDKRLADGFSILANFTWSKLIDDSSSDWGGSVAETRRSLSATLPVFRPDCGRLAGTTSISRSRKILRFRS